MLSRRPALALSLLALALASVTMLLGGCARAVPTAAGTTGSATGTPTASDATAQAHQLLAEAELPPGAKPATTPVAASLRDPAQRAACTPLIDVVRSWRIPHSTLDAVTTFLTSHPSPHLTVDGQGQATGPNGVTSASVIQALPSTTQRQTLVFTFAPLTGGAVGLRVDAQVIPAGAACSTSG